MNDLTVSLIRKLVFQWCPCNVESRHEQDNFKAMMGRHISYIAATSYLRRGRRDVKLRDYDVLRMLFAEWVIFQKTTFHTSKT